MAKYKITVWDQVNNEMVAEIIESAMWPMISDQCHYMICGRSGLPVKVELILAVSEADIIDHTAT